jgi:hypothetical protein
METILRNEKAKQKKYKFSNLFNYSEFSERQEDTELNTGLIIRQPEFYSQLCQKLCELGSAA